MGMGLSSPEVGLIRSAYPDFGQIHYMVDSDYRTAAQGWSRADRTGPLDLYEARKSSAGSGQYVFRTADYSSDAVALQAANDALVDFRGDAIVFTPGNYSIATAQVINVPDARWLGPPVSNPKLARATLTAAAAAAFAPTAAADRMEIGYLRLVPQTAQTMWDVAAVSGLDVHDTFYDTAGVATSTSTIGFVLATTAEHASFRRNAVVVDAVQGPWIRAAGIMRGLYVNDFQIMVEAGAVWAVAINFAGVGAAIFEVGPGTITGGAASTALTSLITLADKTVDGTNGFVYGIRASTVGPAAGSLAVPTTDTATVDVVDCWRAVTVDTAQPTFTSGANISWESGVPYTG